MSTSTERPVVNLFLVPPREQAILCAGMATVQPLFVAYRLDRYRRAHDLMFAHFAEHLRCSSYDLARVYLAVLPSDPESIEQWLCGLDAMLDIEIDTERLVEAFMEETS